MVRPVIVGAAQVANKDPERLAHPVDLIEDAVRLAVADAGADPLPHVGLVLSSPLSVFSDDDGGAMVADRLGIPPGRSVQTTYSGAGPHKLLAEACRAIASGEVEAALIVGGIADSSVRNARLRGLPDPAKPTSVWSQGSDGATREDAEADLKRLERYRATRPQAEGGAGIAMPVSIFALVESAMAAASGRTPDQQREALGRLLVPFTETAATRPDVAWFPQVRTAEEISAVGPSNRFVSEPYTKLMCSFPTIDLAAAVLVTSEALADRIGVSSVRVHPWGIVAAPEPGPPSTWPEMHRSNALAAIAERLLGATLVDPGEIAGFDLYSCFPAAVQLATTAFGVDPFTDSPSAHPHGRSPVLRRSGRVVLPARHRLHRRGGASRSRLGQRRRRRRRVVQRLRRRAAVGRRAPDPGGLGRGPGHHRGDGRPRRRVCGGCGGHGGGGGVDGLPRARRRPGERADDRPAARRPPDRRPSRRPRAAGRAQPHAGRRP